MATLEFKAILDGSPIPNAKIRVAIANTSVLADLASPGGLALANPVTADANGDITVVVPDGFYDVTIITPSGSEYCSRNISVGDVSDQTAPAGCDTKPSGEDLNRVFTISPQTKAFLERNGFMSAVVDESGCVQNMHLEASRLIDALETVLAQTDLENSTSVVDDLLAIAGVASPNLIDAKIDAAKDKHLGTVAQVLANSDLGITAADPNQVDVGQAVFADHNGVAFIALADSAPASMTETAGGLKLDIVPGQMGLDIRGFGVPTDDSVAPAGAMQRALNAADAADLPLHIPNGAKVRFSDAVTLPAKTVLTGGGTVTYTGASHGFATGAPIEKLILNGPNFVGSGTNRLFSIAHDAGKVVLSGVTASGFDKIGDAAEPTTIGRIVVQESEFTNCGSGMELDSGAIGSALISGNLFKDFARASQILCIRLGSNATADQDLRGDYVVSGNTFENIVSSGNNVEVHAIILYGIRGVVSGNTVHTLRNAGNEDAEAIYTKCRYATIIGNTTVNAAFSNDGSISVKGNMRSGNFAPFGYGVTVMGNVVKGDGTVPRQNGIFIQNEAVTCIGNVIEAMTERDIAIVVDEGSTVTVKDNQSFLSRASNCIFMEIDTRDVKIEGNTISEWMGQDAQVCHGILVKTDTVGQEGLSISGNRIVLDAASTATAAWGIFVDTENDGSTFKQVRIDNNDINTSAAGAGRGINIAGEETIDDLSIQGNMVKADGIRELTISPDVVLTGGVVIEGNNFGATYVDANGHNLDFEHMNRPLVYTGAGAQTWNLPRAVLGAKFRLINRNASGDAVGFTATGTDTTFGGNTSATIEAPGAIEVECVQAGVWDVINASSPVTYS